MPIINAKLIAAVSCSLLGNLSIRVLCEDLCSLNPGVDRLTFSVEWVMKESGEIESTWFGRSIIKSCVKLAYDHAQHMIDQPGQISNYVQKTLALPWCIFFIVLSFEFISH